MTKEEVSIDYRYYNSDQCNYDDLKEAVSKLSSATEKQFEEIKKEKWYNRVFDMVTFSKKGEKRIATQIGNVAQAQQILIEILVRLSTTDEKISELVNDCVDKIKQLSQDDNVLMARIKQLENLCILGITKSNDIAAMNENEKQILSGCLFYLMGKYNEISENQKRYANVVLNYIETDIAVPEIKKAISYIENISNKKKILSCCMEYIFLNGNNVEIPEELGDFIDAFDFGNKTITEIKTQVINTYKLRGEDGLIQKYGNEEFEEIGDDFIIEFDSEIEEVIDDELRAEDPTDVFISNILHIPTNETKKFHNNNIHISSYVNCEGDLSFDKCTIYYNESDASDEITLAEGSSISFINCTIICKGYDQTPFIKSTNHCKIIITSCEFLDCSYFLEVNWPDILKIENSKIINCFDKYVSGNLDKNSKFKLYNCLITQNDIAEFNIPKDKWHRNYLFELSGFFVGDSPEISECTVFESEHFKSKGIENEMDHSAICYFQVDKAKISNCTFIGATKCIDSANNVSECNFKECSEVVVISSNGKKVIDNCTFEQCKNVVKLEEESYMSNCQFVECCGKLIETGYSGNVEISFCEFLNSTYDETNQLKGEGCLKFMRCRGKSDYRSIIKNCIFNGADLNQGFLIYCTGFEKPKGTVLFVEDCNFMNCTTKRPSGTIVKQYFQYDTLLKKNIDFKATDISNCKGLDKVNKENNLTQDVRVKTESTTGRKIGSLVVGNVMVMALGGPVGTLVGAAGIAIGVMNINKPHDTVTE